MNKTITVSEIFGITCQGEGALIGKPTVFVRTGGCDYRCSWCDTLYAVLPAHRTEWIPLSAEQIFAEVQRLSPTPIMITLSGGNPAMQPLDDLLTLGKEHKYTFCMETQGSISKPWFKRLDYLTLSPKPPSSGMVTRWDRLNRCVEIARDDNYCTIVLKVVVFDEHDYAYAHEVAERYPYHALYLQAGNEHPPQVGGFEKEAVLKKLEWLIDKVTADRWNSVTVLPQLHSLLWGNKRGV